MSDDAKRFPGWVLVVLMALFIAGFGAAIYFSVRPDPTLPPTRVVPR